MAKTHREPPLCLMFWVDQAPWRGWVGNEWELEGYCVFRETSLASSQEPILLVRTTAIPTSAATHQIPLFWNFREEGSPMPAAFRLTVFF